MSKSLRYSQKKTNGSSFMKEACEIHARNRFEKYASTDKLSRLLESCDMCLKGRKVI